MLGLHYEFINDNIDVKLKKDDILITYSNGKSAFHLIDKSKNIISIKPSNKLFSEDYSKMNYIPEKIKKYNNVISIFNEDKDLYINESFNDKNIIETNIDMVSDIFFMLTRYEEAVNIKAAENERFSRFPAGESFAFKNGFLDRPIVNEQIDLLWNFIDRFDLGYKKKKWWGNKDFAACLTHDVDEVQKYKKFKNLVRPTAKLLIEQGKPLTAIKNFFNYFKGYKKDPYYTFDYIINLEKYYGFRSSFYFMSGGTSEYDNYYNLGDSIVKKLIKQIENEGFEAGYHGSFNSYNDEKTLYEEKHTLDLLFTNKPYGCRQHYLRFQVPYTWRCQESAGLLYDTTLSFADSEGFRCGTCFPFKPYDLVNNRVLNIWEIPLIVMEGSLQNKAYSSYSPEQGLEVTQKLIDEVRKYNGVFTMLYHNSSFDYTEPEWDGWKDTYEGTMKYLYEQNSLGTSGREIINIMCQGRSSVSRTVL